MGAMAHRAFTDSSGQTWDVWTVLPERVERRRRTPPNAGRVAERRRHREYRVPMADEWSNGWLCFQTVTEKRRLSSYPENWASLADSELEQLCHRAVAGPPPRRLAE